MNSIKSLPGKGGRLHFISLPTYLFIFLTLIMVILHQSAFTAQAQSILTAEQLGKVKAQGGFAGLLEKADSAGKVRIIVGLNTSFTPMGALSDSQAVAQEQRIASAQNTFLARLSSLNVTHINQFQFIPYVALTVDGTALQAILASPTVQTVEEDVPVPPTLDLSVPRIGAPSAWARGYTGNGQTVAILDTGVDKTHAFLTGKVTSEACYSTTSTYPSQTVCPGGVTESTATGSAMPYSSGVCPTGACDHGTHVTGITAGGTGGSFSGVAYNANIIAIQVFSYFSSCNCVMSWTSDQIKGLERVYALRNTYAIASVNMSLGGGRYYSQSTCDSDNAAIKAAIDNLRSVNIATVIASGNSYYSDSMGAPGCISTAVSVGATDDADAIASYSNSVSFLNLLAPGSAINSSIPGGGYASWNGTSMATPHVAGAWAILKQASPGASVSTILNALSTTGLSITDSRNSVTKKRINVNEALSSILNGSCTYTLNPTSANFGKERGEGSVTVTTQSGCTWEATNNNSWITFGSNLGTGFTSDFTSNANGWTQHYGTWMVGNGYYYTPGVANYYASASHNGDYSNFTYQASMKREGSVYYVNNINVRGTPEPLSLDVKSWNSGYDFGYDNNGKYRILKWVNGTSAWLQSWTETSAINATGWNVLKVIASGTNLKFYINNTLVWDGTDDSLTTGRVGLGMYAPDDGQLLHVDWATLTTSTSASSASSSEVVSPEQLALNKAASQDPANRQAPNGFKGPATGGSTSKGVSQTGNAQAIPMPSNVSGTGSGTVYYTVAANEGSARTGSMTIAGQTFTVNQNAGSVLYANFGGYGLWKNDTAWSYLHPSNPASMAAGTNLYAYFNGAGLWKYDGASWTYLHPSNPESMTAGSNFYAYFSSYGLYKHDGTAWSYLHPSNPDSMTAGSNLYAFFSGYGLYKHDGSAWGYLHPSNPASMAGGTNLYASFSGAGLWKYNGTTWTYLHPSNPTSMTAGTNLYAYFNGYGLYKYDTAWSYLHPSNPATMAAGMNLYAFFGGYGLYKHDDTAWSYLHPSNPASMVGGE